MMATPRVLKFESDRYCIPTLTTVYYDVGDVAADGEDNDEPVVIAEDLMSFGQYDVQYVRWSPDNHFKLFEQLAALFTATGPNAP